MAKAPGKREAVAAELRRRIVTGVYPRQGRLPTRAALQAEFGICNATVQQVFDMLRHDGFVETRKRGGTRVTGQPPHLMNYALVLSENSPLTRANDGTLISMLTYECLARHQAGRQNFSLYFNVTGHVDEPDFQRLVADVRAQRLAGLLLGCAPQTLDHALLAPAHGIPMVWLQQPHATLGSVFQADHKEFWDKPLGFLAARGRRRLAVIGAPPDTKSGQADLALLLSAAKRHELRLDPCWRLPVDMGQRAEFLVQLRIYAQLLMKARGLVPDAFFITDDLAVAETMKGLQAAGIQPGRDVDVVAQCNYPLRRPNPWPLTRLGLSVPEVLDQAIGTIDRQRRDGNIQRCTMPLNLHLQSKD